MADLPAGTSTVIVASPDRHGVLRGKEIPSSRWAQVASEGLRMARAFLSWTPTCDVRPDDRWSASERGHPDVWIVPVVDPIPLPWRPGTAIVLAEALESDRRPAAVAPRSILTRVVEQASATGLCPKIGFEVEFHLLDATTRAPVAPTIECYGLARPPRTEAFLRDALRHLIDLGLPVEAAVLEHSPGQLEINLRFDDALRTADNAVLFRFAIRSIAREHGLIGSFMTKPTTDLSGSGQHLHHSVWQDGRNLMAPGAVGDDGAGDDGTGNDGAGDDGEPLSSFGRHYLGGMRQHMRVLTLVGSPTPNAFRRRTPYSFAPLDNSWAVGNRSVGLRVIPGLAHEVRIEQRDASSEANPYLVLAGQIAAGLDGVAHALDPGPALDQDRYRIALERPDGLLPLSVTDAAAALERSPFARTVFGADLVDLLVACARYEQGLIDREVTALERERYLEAF